MYADVTDDFQVFVKPVGARCNLRCGYCYYLDKDEVCGEDCRKIMDDGTLENYILHHYAASTSDTVLFTWHGGEPLLAGIDFYKKALAFQKKHLPQGKNFLNGIQTNGTLITHEWGRFLSDNGFTVGISMDGPEALHNAMRRFEQGTGSFEKTLAGYGLLRKYGVNPEILCVVSAYNVYYPLMVYEFFKMLGVQYITFLPLVERNKEYVTKTSVPAFEFGLFLTAIFDEWVNKDIGIVKIQIFEEALRTAFHQEHSLCIFREKCGGVPVIERNGNCYQCDHFVDHEWLIGNINQHALKHLLNHPKQKAFGEAKRNTLPQYCIQCEVRTMCNGECPRNRFITSPNGEPGLNYLCEGYQYFFNHCKPFIQTVSLFKASL
jgi:uncharacterized protein